jgi:hypothetical protein
MGNFYLADFGFLQVALLFRASWLPQAVGVQVPLQERDISISFILPFLFAFLLNIGRNNSTFYYQVIHI